MPAAALRLVPCGPERAEEIHRLTQAAFDAHRAKASWLELEKRLAALRWAGSAPAPMV